MILPTADEESKFAADLIARLPASIRVGAHEFRIIKITAAAAAGDRNWGSCSVCEQSIKIQEWFPTRYKAVETVMHEITHAIWWTAGLLDEDKEERTVCSITSGWVAVHRDNPWFVDWLKSAEL